MSAISLGKLEKVAQACRLGLLSLADSKGSTFNGFPSGACGVATEIFGRVLWERFQAEGDSVSGVNHPQLKKNQSHEWFEVGNFIIDITYDQFAGTGLSGWVFKRGEGWHAQFREQKRNQGFLPNSQWADYPYDGYNAALEEVDKILAIIKIDDGKSNG